MREMVPLVPPPLLFSWKHIFPTCPCFTSPAIRGPAFLFQTSTLLPHLTRFPYKIVASRMNRLIRLKKTRVEFAIKNLRKFLRQSSAFQRWLNHLQKKSFNFRWKQRELQLKKPKNVISVETLSLPEFKREEMSLGYDDEIPGAAELPEVKSKE